MKFFRRSLFDCMKMWTLASMTGVFVPSPCSITSAASDARLNNPSVKPSSSLARIGISSLSQAECLLLRRSEEALVNSAAASCRNGVVGFGERLQHLRRMIFSVSTRYRTGGARMLLEFDADQRLWQ